MCGIAGIIDLKNPVSRELVKRMTDALVHRGPDAEGFYINGGVGLGHRRLSIIDLATGSQPISNEDGTIRVVFNGEIYNYRDLIKQLKSSGHTFTTRADTETIVHLYEDYGDDCITHLRGMFAFALWDERKKRLLIGRDRVGKKPVAYYHRPGKFVFGSEIKALLCDQSVEREISSDAINNYLTFGYIPAPDSIYRHIQKLLPGHFLVYENDRVETRRYWDIKYTDDGPADEKEALQEIERLLLESTSLRMVADVPLGAFLSGGVDSSLVVGLMAHLSDRPVKTFSIGFNEDDYSEIKYARKVAAHLGTEHYEDILEPDIFQVLQVLLEQYDEPFADSSMIPTYLVSQMARHHVTVALSGDGGDEVFAGYNRYTRFKTARRLDHIPGMRRLAGYAARFPLAPPPIKRKLSILATPGHQRQLELSSVIPQKERKHLYTDQFNASLENAVSSRPARLYLSSPDRLNKWLYSDMHAFLPDDILVKVDRASMASSLETRAPLLDQKVIEFMATIPERLKTRGNIGKYLLKKLAKKYVPHEVIYRDKMGFMIPASHWFRDSLQHEIDNKLLGHGVLTTRYVRPEAVRKMIREHAAGSHDHSPALFALFYLELWLRRYAPDA
nr:asparagine synthase (glutamine-hydrolyzing) [candidate division Zixibacteria bacterium]